MKKVYKITSCSTDVYEDSYAEGEGAFCNHWNIDDVCSLSGTEFDSLKELLEKVGDKYLVLPYKQDSANIKDYWFHFADDSLDDELRFDNDCLVDVNNERVDDNDIERWKKGTEKLYNAHTILYVKAVYTEDVKLSEMEEDLKELEISEI